MPSSGCGISTSFSYQTFSWYQVTLNPYKGYFRVLSGKVTNYATYDSIIRDTPRIAYAIQQVLL